MLSAAGAGHIRFPFTNTPSGACTVWNHCNVLAQAAVEQQLGCPMLPCISETTDEERWHSEHGTIDLLQSNLKLRFVAPGDWIRVKFDLKPLVRHACGEFYLRSRQQAGELLMMVYFRPMRALSETSLTSVFHDLHLYLCRRCALDISSQHLTVHLPRRVPVGDRYSLLDLYFACAMMETNMEVFFDDYRVLQLRVTTIPPSPSLSFEGEKCLAFD